MKKLSIILIGLFLACFAQAQSVGSMYQTSSVKNTYARQKYDKARHLLALPESVAEKYAHFKQSLSEKIGLTYTLDASLLLQRGAPNGSQNSWQTQYYTSANWNMFSSKIGDGSIQFAYTYAHYWGISASNLENRVGVITSINDYPSNVHNFDQLMYTHTLPNKELSVSFGQFPMYNFDGSSYDANQQINFINYSLSQNASSTYPTASLGGYISYSPSSSWNFVAGMQDANNVSGEKIQTTTFHKKQYTSFASFSYTPDIENWGSGQYSLMLYNQPHTNSQSATKGWSVNLSQALNDKLTLFARANGTTGNVASASQSYVLGFVVENPFNRNALDQVGFAGSVNKMNKKVNREATRRVENIIEGYYSFGFSNYMILTPDVQFYINPAQDKTKTATVLSLRATLMF